MRLPWVNASLNKLDPSHLESLLLLGFGKSSQGEPFAHLLRKELGMFSISLVDELLENGSILHAVPVVVLALKGETNSHAGNQKGFHGTPPFNDVFFPLVTNKLMKNDQMPSSCKAIPDALPKNTKSVRTRLNLVLSPPINTEEAVAKMSLQVHILSDAIHSHVKR